jgi:hypothetical protein
MLLRRTAASANVTSNSNELRFIMFTNSKQLFTRSNQLFTHSLFFTENIIVKFEKKMIMQKIFILYFSVIYLTSFSQDLTKDSGVIEVKLISQNYKRNADDVLTKRKTNRKKRPYQIMYLDSTGTLLKSVSFGKHHNTDLRMTDKIKTYQYDEEKLTESIEYESDYQKNVYPYWKTKYLYNHKNQLIDESRYHIQTDSVYDRTTYEYDLRSNLIKSFFDPTYYYQREYDSVNRITSLQQIYDSKLRWDWNYTYKSNQRIGIFQTYYNDGENHAKAEIKTYNRNSQLIECEEKYTTKLESGNKIKVYYDNNGLIEKVEYFETYDYVQGYEMIGYKQVKIKTKLDLDIKLSERINERIDIIR